MAEAVLEDRAEAARRGGLGGGDGVDLGEAAGHRLLDDHVEAGLERRDRLRLVQARGRADVDDVEVAVEQRLKPVDGRRDAEPLGDGVGAGGVDVAERRNLVHLRQRLVGLDVRGADARADDADLQPGHAAPPGRAPASGTARRWASSASSMARKQWSCGMAVAVRLRTSSRSRSP